MSTDPKAILTMRLGDMRQDDIRLLNTSLIQGTQARVMWWSPMYAPRPMEFGWLVHPASGAVLPLRPDTLCDSILRMAVDLAQRFQCPQTLNGLN